MFNILRRRWTTSALATYLNDQMRDYEFYPDSGDNVGVFDADGPYAVIGLRDKGRRGVVRYIDDVTAASGAEFALRLSGLLPTTVKSDEMISVASHETTAIN